jgi:hypothetical protein
VKAFKTFQPGKPHFRFSLPCAVAILSLVSAVRLAHGDAGPALKSIDNPGGGHVLYGIFNQESTMQGAMVGMLRKVHTNFGERPEIGQFFQTRDGHTVGTFFSLTTKSQGGRHISGMVMVTMPSGMKPAAAALFDNTERFKTTEPQLMKKLIAAFNDSSSSQGSNQATNQGSGNSNDSASSSTPAHHGQAGPVKPLQTATVGDNSATLGLPAGWHITDGGGGSISAEGPKGESIHMGIINQNNYDPNTQQGRSMIQYMSRSSIPFTSCPLQSDLVADYQCVSHQHRQQRRMPQPTMKVLSVKDLPSNQYEQKVVLVLAEMDFGDGKGLMKCSIRIGVQRLGPALWNLNVNQANIPVNLADEEWPTITAMAASYRQNGQVIQAQTDHVVAQINAAGAANTARFNQHMKDIDQNSKDFAAHMDGIDRQSKSFQNYMLDQSVLQDSEIPARGTVSNPTADAFVKANPDRYQIVPQKDWIRGQDY